VISVGLLWFGLVMNIVWRLCWMIVWLRCVYRKFRLGVVF